MRNNRQMLRIVVDPAPEVRLIGLTAEGPAWRLPSRVIEEYEWIVTVAGAVRFMVAGEAIVLEAGDTLLLEPGIRHSIDWVGPEGTRFYYVHLTPAMPTVATTGLQEAGRREALRQSLREALAAHPFYILPRIRMTDIALPASFRLASTRDLVFTLFERALAERSHYGVDSQLMIALLVSQMLTLAARDAIAGEPDRILSEDGAMDRTLQAALALIHGMSNDRIPIRKLAADLHVSPQYLSRLFTARMGMSPLRYINGLRMERAKALMRNTRMDIQEIAWACGFDNPFYFSRLFRSVVGETPSGYRKRLDFRSN